MNTKSNCQHCGKTLGPEAIEGLCPECLMQMGLGIGTEATGIVAQGKHAFTPPTLADLASRFPQFEILAFIGQGGMGAVYKARQKQLDRLVALKILPPGIGENPTFADRFVREAKAMAKLNHSGIVTIYDFGHAGGLYYFIMELVDGVSLRQLIQTGRVSPREALAIVPQICDALQYAHDQGIVHRDIKPENILLDRQGRVKVADFGLAKLVAAGKNLVDEGAPTGSAGMTEAGKVMGTPSYMAPEQAEHPGEVDHRADIYALGVVFYQMLTGELPGKTIEPPSKKVRIDVRLDEVVLRALEQEPDRRYQQVSQVKTAVETITQNSGTDAPTLGPSEKRKYSWLNKLILGVMFLGVLAVSLIWVLRYRHMLSNRTPEMVRTADVEIPVVAKAVVKGDISVYLDSLGSVESSNSVTFTIPEHYVQEVVKGLDAHRSLPVEAYDRSNRKFGLGSLLAVDNQIDTATGTLKCKASLVPAAGNLMFPGLFLNIRMLLDTKTGVAIVPVAAVQRDAQGAFVWVIRLDQTVTRRPVTLLATEAQQAGIQNGLSPGEFVVIEGQYKLHEGSKVACKVIQQSEMPGDENRGPAESTKPIQDWVKLKALAEWIADLQNSDPKVQKLAERAISELGTNALPEFLGILADNDPSTEGDDRRYNAAAALKFIGPDVKSAIPAFVGLLESGNQERAYAGARALAFITPIVPEAFAPLTNGLVAPSPRERDAATHGVSFLLGSEASSLAEETLPTLVNNLTDKADYVRADTASSLGSYIQRQRLQGRDAKPDLLIPPLMELLHDRYSWARLYSAQALGSYREQAKDFRPALLNLLNDPDTQVRRTVSNLLNTIDQHQQPGITPVLR